MQAIEFETKIEDQSIPLPATTRLRTGSQVRVVLLFDSEFASSNHGLEDGPIKSLMQNPKVIPGFRPLSRDDVHDR
jgi:hypothetical protein